MRVAGEDLPPCRLCFVGAKPAEVERCRVAIDPGNEEDALLRRLHRAGEPGAVETLVAHALAAAWEAEPPHATKARRR